jgi:hypothetical protein
MNIMKSRDGRIERVKSRLDPCAPLSFFTSRLTPKEIHIANLVKDGKTAE